MDPLIRTTLQSLASHYKVDANQVIDLLLTREVLILQSLTAFKKPGSLQELQRTVEKRDPKVTELCNLMLNKLSDLDVQMTGTKQLLAELQRMRPPAAEASRGHPGRQLIVIDL